MNSNLKKLIEDHPALTSDDKLDNAALGHVRSLSELIQKKANELHTICVNYHVEVVRQADLKERRKKVIASTPKPDPNPKSKG